ncbi:MAG: TIGR01777 family oxidoreductase [Gemmatimonadetes bacterium]|nr:TIGR01777 family oxidoreductase [Gemmatimonadota bacterium]
MIIITGATGFVGRAVCDALRTKSHRVVTIGRDANSDVQWPARGDFDADALAKLSGARAAVHLAGEPIGARWTAARKDAILRSRVDATATLARALASLSPKPAAMISASAIGYYGNRGDEWLDESSAAGDDFLSGVVRAWEDATQPAAVAGLRVVRLRFGLVFGRGGGMLDQVRLPFSLGAGGVLGSGTQWMSWVALDDLVRVVVRAIDDPQITGAVNVVSPNPVRNAEFTAALGMVLRRPAVIPVPAFALRALFGEMADGALLASQRVRPARLLASEFAFDHPTVDGALRAALTP